MRTDSRLAGRGRDAGFTLLELLVAVALFATVAVIAYSGLAALVRAEESLARSSRDWADLQLALQMIETDLSQAVDRPVRDPLGGILPAFQFTRGGVAELGFSRLGSGLLMGSVSQLQRISYIVDGGRLVRRLRPYPDQVQGSPVLDAEMLDGMDGIEFAFVGPGMERTPLWPRVTDNPSALPRAVEVVIEHPVFGRIQRLLAVQP